MFYLLTCLLIYGYFTEDIHSFYDLGLEMASANFVKEKSASVKYHRIDMSAHKTQFQDGQLKETRYGKFLRRTVNFTGCLLVLSLLAVLGISTYQVVSGIRKEQPPSGKALHRKISTRADQCTNVENNRFDCFPEKFGVSEGVCVSRGCCWRGVSRPDAAPVCFFPTDYQGYTASDLKSSPSGITATLHKTGTAFYPRDVKTLKLVVEYQTTTRLRLRVMASFYVCCLFQL